MKFGPWNGLLVLGLMAGAAGCSSSEGPDLGTPTNQVTASSFAGPRSSPVDAGQQAPGSGEKPAGIGQSASGAATVPVMAIGGKPSTSAVTGAQPSRPLPIASSVVPSPALTTTVDRPPTIEPRAGALGVNVLVESLVGQINGQPVFASEILEPLDGRLRQIGASAANEQAWLREAGEAIKKALDARIQNDLILAEAKRNLTPEQKQGLFQFLQQVESNLASTQKGSSIAADEALKEATGRGIRAEAQDRLDGDLIRKELTDKVASRAVVSWSDIKNEYERSWERYNPPSVAVFRMIIVDPKKPENAATVAAELASGKAFAEIAASDLNTFNRPESGKMDRKFALTQAEGDYLPDAERNQACRTLSVGQVVGPITYSTRLPPKDGPAPPADPASMRTAWLFLERIDTPEGVPLYDAQLEIESRLLAQRRGDEIARYMEQLIKRGNISRREIMLQRLNIIAMERYAPRFLNAPATPQKKK